MEDGVFPTSRALFDDEKMEEERRLCYVGITRARKRLCMSWAQTRALYGSRQVNMRSRFVDEIPQRLIEDANAAVRPQTRLGAPREAANFGMRRPQQTGFGARPAARPAQQQPAGGIKPQSRSPLDIPGLKKGMGAFKTPGAAIFKKGDRVRHNRFGEGTVLLLYDDNKRMTIRFDDGTEKTFAAELAPVVRLDGKAE